MCIQSNAQLVPEKVYEFNNILVIFNKINTQRTLKPDALRYTQEKKQSIFFKDITRNYTFRQTSTKLHKTEVRTTRQMHTITNTDKRKNQQHTLTFRH